MVSFRVLILCTVFTCIFILLWTFGSWNYGYIIKIDNYNWSQFFRPQPKMQTDLIHVVPISQQLSNATKQNVTKVLLVTYLRGGSSFLGDIVQSGSGSFYIFEPLLYLLTPNQIIKQKTKRIPAPLKRSEESVRFLKDILNCNFTKRKDYVEWAQENQMKLNIFQRNHAYWRACKHGNNTDLCYSIDYLTAYCLNSTFRIIKTTRMSVKNSGILLTKLSELKIVHLVRDPRAVLNSRHRKPISKWCRGSDECWLAQHFCRSVKTDLISSCTLQNQFPTRFAVVRYEDVACRPYDMSRLLFRFMDNVLGNDTLGFLDSHTKQWGAVDRNVSPGEVEEVRLPEAYSTHRVSQNVPFAWQMTLSDSEIFRAESFCETVLEALRLPLVGDIEPEKLSCETLIFNDTNYDRLPCPRLLQEVQVFSNT